MSSISNTEVDGLGVTLLSKADLNGHFGYEPGRVIEIDAIDHSLQWVAVINRMNVLAFKLDDIYKNSRQEKSAEELATMKDEFKTTLESYSHILQARCSHCGDMLSFKAEGETITVSEPCDVYGDRAVFEVDIAVPSGKLVFANDLRRLVVVDRTGLDLNAFRGIKGLSANAARCGLALISVGNTCPDVYVRDGELRVGNVDGALAEGSIITDLWWYSAMDHDFFLERCFAESVDPDSFDYFAVDVEPGVYAFSYEFKSGNQEILSRIRKVEREVEAPEIPSLESEDISFANSRCLKVVAGLRSDVGPEVLSHIFTTIGNGLRWVDGNLIDVSGRDDDAPHSKKLEAVEKVDVDLRIPFVERLDEAPLYRATLGFPPSLGRVPSNVSIHWLALGMIYCRGLLDGNLKTIGRDPEKSTAEAREVLKASLTVMQDIAQERGLWANGRLEVALTEVASWLEVKIAANA